MGFWDRFRRRAPAAVPPARRLDAYVNAATGLGTAIDPSTLTRYRSDVVGDDEARDLWLGNDFAAKVVELKPRDAFRAGFRVVVKDEDQAKEIAAYLRRLKSAHQLMLAAQYARAYAGGAVYPVVNDGQTDLSQPLRLNRIPTVERLQVLEARELYPVSWYRSIRDEKYGQPSHYRLQSIGREFAAESNQVIHESRLIIFRGISVGRGFVGSSNGWDSVSHLTRCAGVIQSFGSSWQGVESLMHRIEQGVVKLKQLREMSAEDGESGQLTAALREMNMLRSMFGLLVLGDEDDYQRLGVPLSGVADVLEKMMIRLSAACDTPVTKLFGREPAGQNATGKSDNDNWDDAVAAERDLDYEEKVEQLVRVALSATDSPTRGKVPEDFAIAWAPLTQPDEKAQAETNYVQAQADDLNIQNGVYTAAIARKRYGAEKIVLSTTITEEEMRELEELQAAATEAQQAALEGVVAEGAESEGADDENSLDRANQEGKPPDPDGARSKNAQDSRDRDDASAPKRLRRKAQRMYDVNPRRTFAGVPVVVENPAGSTREWAGGQTVMLHDYGYVDGSLGADGEGVDVYLGPEEDSAWVHVVHQLRPDGQYDEDKSMIGWRSADAARAAYLAHRDDGERAFGGMTTIPVEKFRAKVAAKSGRQITADSVVHERGRWYVRSADGTRNLGDPGGYATEAEAVARLRQVEGHAR